MRCSVRWLRAGCAVMGGTAAAVLAALLAIPGTARAQSGPERIVSYDIAITIQHDGTSLVTEQIVYDFGGQQRHGIFRQIPVRFSYNSGYDRVYPVTVLSVRSPDAPAQYAVSNDGSSVTIRIGDPSRTITGQHTYQITYLIRGALNGFADHDELYWNAIGGQWDVPIGRAVVRVTVPGTVTRAACYAGPLGATTSCDRASTAKTAATFTQSGLGPQEFLTVVVGFPKGLVAPPRPILTARWSLQRAFAVTPASAGIAGGLLAVFAALGAVIAVRRRHLRHPRPAAQLAGTPLGQPEGIMPPAGHDSPALESEPPAGLRPAQASTLLDGVVKARDITGTVVDLAVRGYLRIEDISSVARRDWRLTRLGKTGGLLPYEQKLLDGLFTGTTKDPDPDAEPDSAAEPDSGPGTASIQLSDLGAEFAAALKDARDALYSSMTGQGWVTEHEGEVADMTAAALYSSVTSRGWFTARPDQVRRSWRTGGIIMFAIGVIAVIVTAAHTQFALAPVPLVLAGLVMVGCARRMPVRTAEGNDLARRVLGFRKCLVISAAGQARPAAQPATLYDYLPYAIALGCTQEWAGLTAALAGADQPGQAPPWYQGQGVFSPRSLTSLSRSAYYFSYPHNIAIATGQVVSGLASSGSASGSSGFGGGYSGGGGGGGGGGSW
jgi:uncharacterized membrane protein YgcG